MDDMVRQLERREEKPQSYERKSLTARTYFYLLCKVLKFYFFCLLWQESVDATWLTEPSSKEKRRTSSPIVELITGDKQRIINREDMEFRRVSLFDVSE